MPHLYHQMDCMTALVFVCRFDSVSAKSSLKQADEAANNTCKSYMRAHVHFTIMPSPKAWLSSACQERLLNTAWHHSSEATFCAATLLRSVVCLRFKLCCTSSALFIAAIADISMQEAAFSKALL